MTKLELSDCAPCKSVWFYWLSSLKVRISFGDVPQPLAVDSKVMLCFNKLLDAAYAQGVEDVKSLITGSVYQISNSSPTGDLHEASDLLHGRKKN